MRESKSKEWVTGAELARIAKTHPQHIYRLRRQGRLNPNKDKLYHVPTSLAVIEGGRALNPNPAVNGNHELSDLAKSRQILEAWKAKLAELEYLERKKKLVPIEDVEEFCGNLLAVVRTKFLALPAKMAPLVSETSNPKRNKALLEAEVYNILIDLAGMEDVPGNLSKED